MQPKEKENESMSKAEKCIIIGLTSVVFLLFAIYIIGMIVYGKKLPEDVPYIVRFLLN